MTKKQYATYMIFTDKQWDIVILWHDEIAKKQLFVFIKQLINLNLNAAKLCNMCGLDSCVFEILRKVVMFTEINLQDCPSILEMHQ